MDFKRTLKSFSGFQKVSISVSGMFEKSLKFSKSFKDVSVARSCRKSSRAFMFQKGFLKYQANFGSF